MTRAVFEFAFRIAASVLLASGLFLSFAAPASASQPFDARKFEAARKENRPILIDVTASWCPVCRIQGLIIKRAEANIPQLVVFTVDFDDNPEALERFGVSYQSTLIVFKGPEEIARSIGDTDEDRIDAMIRQGL